MSLQGKFQKAIYPYTRWLDKLINPFAYKYAWPQVSSCSSIMLYTLENDTAELLVTERDPSVGEGQCLSAGGFDEVKDVLKRPNKKRAGRAETYREMFEELGEAIKTIIPYKWYARNVQYVDDILRHIGTGQAAHKDIFRSLQISKAQMDAIMELPPTKEQKGKIKLKFNLNAAKGPVMTNEQIRTLMWRFKYEVEVVAALKWHHKLVRAHTPSLAIAA